MASRKHPDWLKVKIPGGEEYKKIKDILTKSKLNTICQEAKCPNIAECFAKGRATFLILGDTCSRNCTYCNVKSGEPKPLDAKEPLKIAKMVKRLKLNHVVITSVTRDDLKDGGSMAFLNTMLELKKLAPDCRVELLIPDFNGSEYDLRKVVYTHPDVLAHNLEVVRKLFPKLRPEGNYDRSIKLLKVAKLHDPLMLTKSGLMLGLGETKEEVMETLHDLREADCDVLTLGQYLQPSKKHHPIKKYYRPEEFEEFKNAAYELGFKHVEAGPLVRSSYNAEEIPLLR